MPISPILKCRIGQSPNLWGNVLNCIGLQSMSQTPNTPITKGAGYVIHLENFEGPLELLLYLIERQELDITAVSVAQVTDQYLEYIARAENVSPALMADFIAMAARLLQIKSRALLPRPAESEEGEEEDPAELLAQQLRAYRQFREVAKYLSQREREHLRAYIRTAPPPTIERPPTPGEVSLADLLAALRRALEEHEPEPELTVVTPYPVTIQDKIGELRTLLRTHRRIDFTQLLRKSRHRQEIIVSFLAVLELLKQGEILIRQDKLFGPIIIEPAPTTNEDGEASRPLPVHQ